MTGTLAEAGLNAAPNAPKPAPAAATKRRAAALDCPDGTPLLDVKTDRASFTLLAPRQPGDDQVGDPG